jgi:hypothetical protein
MRILIILFVAAFAACQSNSKVNTGNAINANVVPQHVAFKEPEISTEEFQKHWQDYIHLKLLRCEKVMHGGFKKLQYSLDNDSPFMIDSVCLKVNYLDEKQKLYKFENVSEVDIEQGETITLYAPESARGIDVEAHIETLIIKDAALNYNYKKPKKVKKH